MTASGAGGTLQGLLSASTFAVGLEQEGRRGPFPSGRNSHHARKKFTWPILNYKSLDLSSGCCLHFLDHIFDSSIDETVLKSVRIRN
ncbi:uncharacterized protein K444DRAFT_621274 [Hyaloscypha bicolor E]|uniref:Uncharacterized protein n=1 Tax=Hyaloscypha bicolor E TaxID=1095630 RepID=A0A2J6SMX2_9HELO|nr:uncharacterized protein K444DRAFT_621274 [Hyaloscypha bicolor E]PMD52127.1 hypothetical protein K444DRAFT_621274 [Hyaloscypha bicolor E]